MRRVEIIGGHITELTIVTLLKCEVSHVIAIFSLHTHILTKIRLLYILYVNLLPHSLIHSEHLPI